MFGMDSFKVHFHMGVKLAIPLTSLCVFSTWLIWLDFSSCYTYKLFSSAFMPSDMTKTSPVFFPQF